VRRFIRREGLIPRSAQLDLIRAEAARRSVAIHIVIDLIHVLEYL
jgi:hypothetical protein